MLPSIDCIPSSQSASILESVFLPCVLSCLCFLCVFLMYLSFILHISQHISHHLFSYRSISHLFLISPISLCLSIYFPLSSFEATPSLLHRGGSLSLPFLRSDALALLRDFLLLTRGLWQTDIWKSLAASVASPVARESVNEVSCVHAEPQTCKRSSHTARTLGIC